VGQAHHRRFFVPPSAIQDDRVTFSPEQAHQMGRVLRLSVGDRVRVCDGSGREWEAGLILCAPRRAQAALHGLPRQLPVSRLAITLAQGIARGAALETILVKATELGAARLVPIETERSLRRAADRIGRWDRLLREAAEQCGRAELPVLEAPCSLTAFLRSRSPETPLLLCEPIAEAVPMPEACGALRGTPAVALLVGGEGGWSPEEIGLARAAGARPVSLGPRRLRADTAALTALALVQAYLGDLGRPDEPPPGAVEREV
jgi:16S rRNA (uracil1498-N3)-methyltransferase